MGRQWIRSSSVATGDDDAARESGYRAGRRGTAKTVTRDRTVGHGGTLRLEPRPRRSHPAARNRMRDPDQRPQPSDEIRCRAGDHARQRPTRRRNRRPRRQWSPVRWASPRRSVGTDRRRQDHRHLRGRPPCNRAGHGDPRQQRGRHPPGPDPPSHPCSRRRARNRSRRDRIRRGPDPRRRNARPQRSNAHHRRCDPHRSR